MRKGTIQKIEEEINEKRKMPKKEKELLRKEIFTNIIICACLVAYFLFLFLGSVDKTKAVRVIDLKIFSTIYLATSIILFEIAYKKDSGKIAIHGIEILLVAIMTLFLPYIIFELDSKHQKIYYFVGEYIAAYYVIKCICIAIIRKRKYSKDVSDIKEIVKKEKRTIKDEEVIEQPKIVVENKKEEQVEEKTIEKPKRKTTKKKTEPKKEIEQNKPKETEKIKSTEKKNAVKPKTKTTTKSKTIKKEAVAKETKTTAKNKSKKEIELKKEEAPKRRGRPKKQETIEKEKTEAKVEEPKKENTPKKRGRPRKVVTQ